MSGTRNKQQPAVDPTAWVQVEDESLATNQAAIAIPYTWGEAKTTARWFTPIYGQRVVQAKSSGGGKGGK
jgi:hypothetical protein